jgi:hypothetical protein
MYQYPTMENESFAWIMDKRVLGLFVTTGMIQTEALRIFVNGNCLSSNGWLDRFMKRKRLFRRITTSGRELSRDASMQNNTFLRVCEPCKLDFDRDYIFKIFDTSIQLIYRFMYVTVTKLRFSRPLRYLFTVLKINFGRPI